MVFIFIGYWLLAIGRWQLPSKYEIFFFHEAANSQRPKARGGLFNDFINIR